MPASYAAFRVDPSINFDNFNLGWDDTPVSPSISNFSRPISYRAAPTLSPHFSQHSFALSDSSRRSSFSSTRGPLTPKDDAPARDSIARPRITTPENDPLASSSWMLDTKAPKLDLSFSMESVMKTYQSVSTPSSPVTSSMPLNNTRPLTGMSLYPPPSPRPCPIHGARKSHLGPKSPCPIHGAKLPSSALSGAPTFPDARESLGERPPGPQSTPSSKSLPALPFLNHDPFAPQSTDHDQSRPKSAGVGAQRSSSGDGDYVPKKQSAPSIMSTRSTRSIRKGFSRMRRMLSRANLN